MGTLDVVVGGQFGSEAKGHVTQRVTERHLAVGRDTLVVRVAGPNAGHSVVVNGEKWAMRQVPVGFAAAGESGGQTTLAIAAGSEIDMPVLVKEIGMLRAAGLLDRWQLWVDPEATLIEDEHKAAESDRGLTNRLGSTGKGIGAARADRIWRTARRLGDEPLAVRELIKLGVKVGNTGEVISRHLDARRAIVVEGTQGFGLGLHSGFYPYATSSDCRAIDFLAMAGVMPWSVDQRNLTVWVVMRPYPIRVAGDSGPIHHETSWEGLGLEPELTTVTQKVRRVGMWDAGLVRAAIQANGGGWANGRGGGVVRGAMTMVDQVFPDVRGWDEPKLAGIRGQTNAAEVWAKVERWVAARENDIDAPIDLITTSDRTAVWLR